MAETMMALVKQHRAPGLSLAQVPIPSHAEDEVLIRVEASSICGTDLHIYNWDQWAENNVPTPNIAGHEFAGVIVAVGEQVSHLKVGDHVSAEGHLACGKCRHCRTGNAHVCPRTKSIGISAPGCFAEYIAVKASNVIVNHPSLPHHIASLQDPLGNAVQSVLSGEIVGKSVAVIGTGPIGLMAIHVARQCGAATIIAVDVNDFRLTMAKQYGANHCINSRDVPMVEGIAGRTGGEGIEVVLEMSGNARAIHEAFQVVSPGGRMALLGIPQQSILLDLARDIVFKGIQVHGITGRKMYQTWYQMKGLLETGQLQLESLITHRFRLDQYEEAFSLMQSGQCGKIVFTSTYSEQVKEERAYVDLELS